MAKLLNINSSEIILILLSFGFVMTKAKQVYLPPAWELGPAPPPPDEERKEEEPEIEEFKQEEPEMEVKKVPLFSYRDIPVISHNIKLIESDLNLITSSHTPSFFTSNLDRLAEHIKDFKRLHSKISEFVESTQEDEEDIIKTSVIEHFISLNNRMNVLINRYDEFIKKNQSQLPSNSATKRLSNWSAKPGRQRGSSFLGMARGSRSSIDPLIVPFNDREQVIIEREEIVGECSICWEDMNDSLSDKHREFMLLCGHSFCFQCLNELCFISIYDMTLILDLCCPWQDCGHKLDYTEVQNLLDVESYQDYERNRYWAQKQRDPNTRYCTEPECSALIDNGSDENPHITCPSCSREYCFKCMRIWHDGTTCDENIQNNVKSDDSQLQFEEWVAENGAKPCPSCKITIEKESGKFKYILF